jgi:hypothetical protein
MQPRVRDVVEQIYEIIAPSIVIRREALKSRGFFTPREDYPMTPYDLMEFLELFVKKVPDVGRTILNASDIERVNFPSDTYDGFLRYIENSASTDAWLGGKGHRTLVSKPIVPEKIRETTFTPEDLQNTRTLNDLTIHSPSLSILGLLFRQRIDVDRLGWRDFEKLVAELLESEGYDVELQRGTKDGGVDIIASKSLPTAGFFKTIWQAKKLHSDRKVGLDTIRELADVRQETKATKAFIVTSSFLTGGALARIRRDEYCLGKVERPDLERWIDSTLLGRDRRTNDLIGKAAT